LTICYRDGELKEYIAAGVPKDEFLRRIGVLLESRATSNEAPALSAPVAPQTQDPDPNFASNSTLLPSEEPPQTQHSSTAVVTSQTAGPAVGDACSGANPQDIEQKKSDKGKQRAESEVPKPPLQNDAPGTPHKAPDHELKYALMLKKRQQDARNERARILKRVEDDKIARRKLTAKRKVEASNAKDGSGSTEAGSSRHQPQTSRKYQECALQIRLFDGTTIRSRFPSLATLKADVRTWIDSQQTDNVPYTFKQVLTPLPNRNISVSDEEQSLQSQGFAPSATLILMPGKGYVPGNDDSSGSGLIPRGVSAGYGWATWSVGMVAGLFRSILGGGPAPQLEAEDSVSTNTAQSAPNINIRTLRDQNRQDEQQFYNGNAVSEDILCRREFN
jgi:hypothetical protein